MIRLHSLGAGPHDSVLVPTRRAHRYTMVVNTVGHLAEAAWHHPDLTVSYAFVIVKLVTHSAKGVTDKDFELARRIEDTLTWRPGPGSALEGTPDDPRFQYIKYD